MAGRTYPIILAHGIARFDILTDIALDIDNQDALDDKHYFKNVRSHLRARDFDAWHSHVDWAGSVARRASDLKREVESVLRETRAEKVHIIGHSMGGLDSRHMLFENRASGFHRKIASVTTIATPHAGSPVADLVVDPFGFLNKAGLESVDPPEAQLAEMRASEEFREFARVFRMDPDKFGVEGAEGLESLEVLSGVAGVRDLTTERTAAFNQQSLDWESTSGVFFQAFAGAEPRERIFFPLRFAWSVIHRKEGDNDGLVSVGSAMWRQDYFQSTLDADHLNELGWWPDIEDGEERLRKEKKTLAFFLGVAEGLSERYPI